ncbi:MAG: dihydroorotate dehydrogenase electron transfer subunit [Candidatus Neomarinimicrobiota bacterium]
MRNLTEAIVLENNAVAKNIYRMTLKCPEISRSAQPGQFVNIYFSDRIRIFPRPFSVAGATDEILTLIYRVVGAQTHQMAAWKDGQTVRILGPLGNQFSVESSVVSHVLVGGGVGVAPLMFLAEKFLQNGIDPLFFLGVKNRDEMPDAKLFGRLQTFYPSSDDGTTGFHGTAVDNFLSRLPQMGKPIVVYACGPEKMNAALARLAEEYRFVCQISFERVMACGLGLCQGCTVKKNSTDAEAGYLLVCKDGPVFRSEEVIFDD